MTKLIIDGSEVDLSPATTIALTFQVNDIAEVRDRQSNHSNQFKLPLTANNKSVLESSEKINSVTDVPYTKLPAKLIQDGVEIVPNGIAVLDQTADFFEAIVYSGNKSFFDLIEGLKLSDLDLSDLDHLWNLDEVVDRIANTEEIIYPIVDYGNAVWYERMVDVRYLLPHIFLHTIVSKIFEEAGWTVSGLILENPSYLNRLISTVSLKEEESYLLALAVSTADTAYSGLLGNFAEFDDEVSDPMDVWVTGGVIVQDPGGLFTSYRAHVKGKYSFKFVLNWLMTGPTGGYIEVMSSGNQVSAHIDLASDSTGTETIIIDDLELDIGGVVQVFYRGNTIDDAVKILAGSTMECIKADADISFGKLFSIGNNLPNLTQKDFLKAVFQLYCIISQPKPNSTEMQLVQFSEIIAKKPIAKDWSDKLDNQEPPVIQYHATSYAQKNWLRYKPDESVQEELGDGYFTVPDQSLEEEKDLFTLPFAASEMTVRLNGLSIPEILRVDGAEIKDSSPRILILDRRTIDDEPITYTDGTDDYENEDPENMAYFSMEGKTENLSFQNNLIALYYPELVRILNSYKKVIAALKIDQIDISELNHFIPVYIKSFGHYFYLNKIVQWISGRLAQTELIKIDNEPVLFPSSVPLFDLQEDACLDLAAILLTPVISGGFFFGPGVIPFGADQYFDPGTAGVGTHTITYQIGYQTFEREIEVHVLPTVTLADFDPVDVSDPPFALTGGSPGGGVYSGTGVSGGNFNPATAGAGTHTITYTYSDEFTCESNAQKDITVNP